MSSPWYKRLSDSLGRSREKIEEQLNVLFDRGPEVDEDFWEELEETLIASDMGAIAASEIVEDLRDQSTRRALPDANAVRELLVESIAAIFPVTETDLFEESPVVVMMIGINGTGKTTTTGKLAKLGVDAGRKVLLGSADTFRAAATEQLDIWAERAGVEVVKRERGSDPASVSFETVVRAEQLGADLVIIDTAGRLHTSDDLMRELEKVHRVTVDRSKVPVKVVLVMDATTGQNGLVQARRYTQSLPVDGIVITKLDGTAKGGIAVAIARELGIPIVRIGFGETIDDLKPFSPTDFASALLGE